MQITDMRFEKVDGDWRLVVEYTTDDGMIGLRYAPVPPGMILDMAPPCQTGSGVA